MNDMDFDALCTRARRLQIAKLPIDETDLAIEAQEELIEYTKDLREKNRKLTTIRHTIPTNKDRLLEGASRLQNQ